MRQDSGLRLCRVQRSYRKSVNTCLVFVVLCYYGELIDLFFSFNGYIMRLLTDNRVSYLVDMGVCFLTLCEASYPRLLAFSMLFEIQKEFFENFSADDVNRAQRPYSLIQFGTSPSTMPISHLCSSSVSDQ